MRVILTGASGRMGRQMLALFQSAGDIKVVAVDKKTLPLASRTDVTDNGKKMF